MKRNTNYIDTSFNNLINFIKEKSLDEMIKVIKQNFNYLRSTNLAKFNSIVNFYNEYKLWGEIDFENNNFELAKKNAEALIYHVEDFEWLYHKLEDYRSKTILTSVLYYWIMIDDQKIDRLKDLFYSQYFDLDIIECDEDEIFVDVGAYTGDTMINYVKTFGEKCYKKIFCYEIVPANIKYIKQNIKNFKLKNIVIKKKGASDNNGKLFLESDGCSSIKKLAESGAIEVETTKIDNDIRGKVTFIKMDIEGGELLALKGLEKKIKKYKPKLAISVYHNNDHLWEIPKIIHEMNPNYKFYLRYYGGPILPTEYILYAI